MALARTALLRRLEDDHRRAREIARLGEIFGGAEQHGGVAVMAAGMHLARHGRLVRETRLLFEWQSVHVGAQTDHLGPGLAAANDTDHAGSPDAGHDLIATETLEPVGNGRRRAVHIVEELRMRVQVTPPGRDLGMKVGDAVDDRHETSSSFGTGPPAWAPI